MAFHPLNRQRATAAPWLPAVVPFLWKRRVVGRVRRATSMTSAAGEAAGGMLAARRSLRPGV